MQFGFAQRPAGDRIKAAKTAFITNKLDLSSDEAAKFWPVYNESEKKVFQYKKELRQMGMRINKGEVSESDAGTLLEKYIATQTKIHQEEMTLISKLKGILPAMKIIKLKKAEEDFNKQIIKQMQKRRENRQGGNFRRNN